MGYGFESKKNMNNYVVDVILPFSKKIKKKKRRKFSKIIKKAL